MSLWGFKRDGKLDSNTFSNLKIVIWWWDYGYSLFFRSALVLFYGLFHKEVCAWFQCKRGGVQKRIFTDWYLIFFSMSVEYNFINKIPRLGEWLAAHFELELRSSDPCSVLFLLYHAASHSNHRLTRGSMLSYLRGCF